MLLGYYALIVLGLLLIYTLVEPHWLEQKIYTIASPEIPASFHNMKIVFLSDLHHGAFLSINRLKRVVEKVNRLAPDLVLLGGDYLYGSAKHLNPCFRELAKLKATFGVYGVLGNHEHRKGPDLARQCMAEAGIHLLDNRAYWLEKEGEKIKVGGVGDYYHDTPDLTPTVQDVTAADFVILVTHNPDYVEEMETDKIDLVFAGHTHGGQVTLFGLWAPLTHSRYGQKYRTGLVSRGKMSVIVSNGVGTIIPPVRFFARPQIIMVELKRKEEREVQI